MRSGRRGSARRSREIFFKPWIGGVDELMGGTIEDDPAFVYDEKLCAVINAIVGDLFHLASFRVKAVSRQQKGILESVSDDQGCRVCDVALLDDKVDDGG